MSGDTVCFVFWLSVFLLYGAWCFIYWAAPGDFVEFRKSRFGYWIFSKINPEEQECSPCYHGDNRDNVGKRQETQLRHSVNLLPEKKRKI